MQGVCKSMKGDYTMTTATAAVRSRGAMPYDPEKTRRLVVHVDLDLAAQIDEHKRRFGLTNTSDVLRRLLVLGLEQERATTIQPSLDARGPGRKGRGGR